MQPWAFERDPVVADRLFETVEAKLHNPSNEPLWGKPGSAPAAMQMAEATGEVRWAALLGRRPAAAGAGPVPLSP